MVRKYKIKNLSKEFLNKLRKLTICPSSGMNEVLDQILDPQKDPGFIVVAYNNKAIVGWALVSTTKPFFIGKSKKWFIQVYVNEKFRNKKIGEALISRAQKDFNKTLYWHCFSFIGVSLFNKLKKGKSIV